jgi:hypothetical protein
MTDAVTLLGSRQVSSLMMAAGFSGSSYRVSNGDVDQACPTDVELFEHFIKYGADEGRNFQIDLVRGGFTELWQETCGSPLHNVACGMLRAAVNSSIKQNGLSTALKQYLTWTEFNFRPVIVIGDSHTQAYGRPFARDGFIVVPFVLLCTGGSALGLGNPKSVSQYGPMIANTLESVRSSVELMSIPVLFKFGQVDLEFVINFKRARHEVLSFKINDYEAFFEQSTTAYSEYLERVVPEHGRTRVDVVSIFPPVLSDEAIRNGYFNEDIAQREGVVREDLKEALRLMTHPDWGTRVKLHAAYNTLIEAKTSNLGFAFVDDFFPIIGEDGLPRTRFWKRHNGFDHHVVSLPGETVFSDILWERLSLKR